MMYLMGWVSEQWREASEDGESGNSSQVAIDHPAVCILDGVRVTLHLLELQKPARTLWEVLQDGYDGGDTRLALGLFCRNAPDVEMW